MPEAAEAEMTPVLKEIALHDTTVVEVSAALDTIALATIALVSVVDFVVVAPIDLPFLTERFRPSGSITPRAR